MTATILPNSEKVKLGIFTANFVGLLGRDTIDAIRKRLSDLCSKFTPENISGMKAVMRNGRPGKSLALSLEMTIDGRLLCDNGDGLQIRVNLAAVLRKERAMPHETWKTLAPDAECVLPDGTVITSGTGYIRPFEGKLWLNFNDPTDDDDAPDLWFMVTSAKKRMVWPKLLPCTDCDACGLNGRFGKLMACADCDGSCGLGGEERKCSEVCCEVCGQ